ncbi:alpha/beta hydrolase family protein [Paenibacillus sp. SGZ-1009]|uniref:alpha/beta hydrolase family protein n=1 Tax=Paenibacillus campi TaxID=3106031 RepID=UPI002AFE0EA1|nr:prolyl oligopeptidase family serine peptidase [Paenibacillus sp. SGZ-1009]
MIYRVSYVSDTYKVKGYVALPYGMNVAKEALELSLRRFYGRNDLEVEEIACPLRHPHEDVQGQHLSVFVYCRGGIGRVGSVRATWLERFAQHGQLVFAPCYRGAEGGEGWDQFGGADAQDVRSALDWLSTLPYVNAARISLMGFSRGSVNATLAAATWRHSDNGQGIYRLVLWGGVADLALTYAERIDLRRMLKRVIGGSTGKYPERYAARSPVALAPQLDCPVLIIHGEQDRQVDSGHGKLMRERLEQLHKPFTVHWYEQYGHHMPEHVHRQAIARMFDWIEGTV